MRDAIHSRMQVVVAELSGIVRFPQILRRRTNFRSHATGMHGEDLPSIARLAKSLPRRFVLEQNVGLRVEFDELGSRNAARDSRPSASGITSSLRACRTSVDVRTLPRYSDKSTTARASSSLATTAPGAVLRQRSLNHCSCSRLASGTKRDVKT